MVIHQGTNQRGIDLWQIGFLLAFNQMIQLFKGQISFSMAMPMVAHNMLLMLLVCSQLQWVSLHKILLHRIFLHNSRLHHHKPLNVLFHNLSVNSCYHIYLFLRTILLQVLEYHLPIKLQLWWLLLVIILHPVTLHSIFQVIPFGFPQICLILFFLLIL